ncbi:MAG: hypothetical protein HeimC2_08590 [Candidatus Heimdallarchaeota archaeon LC_2]|nr:MAG: hypothetical protein HeimC2_08590 [Candidatus Heimdallarchaeota archaeon LC_2]
MDLETERIKNRVKCLTNPLTFRIIAEIINNPEITSKELKQKIDLSGSRIFYFINLLVEAEIIGWNKTEKISTTLSRRKFEIHESFKTVLDNIGNPSLIESQKEYYIMQLSMLMAVVANQLNDLVDIPDEEFASYLKQAGIPSVLTYPFAKDIISSTLLKNHS